MKKILKIIVNPDPSLRKKSKIIADSDIKSKKMQELCFCMEKTMLVKDGIGLAAPQIGKGIRLIIINTKEGPVAMFNPKIIKNSWSKEVEEEGCLSVPNVFGDVKRFKKVSCEYKDSNAEKVCVEASGLMARVIQHEIDHLDGILFIDKADNIKIVDPNKHKQNP